jgi:hypothetical protein
MMTTQVTKEEKLAIIDKYPEMLDFALVIIAGRAKYGDENWLLPHGTKQSRYENADSMFHHLSEYREGKLVAKDSTLPPELHLACRALMAHTRKQRNIKHPKDDYEEEVKQSFTGFNCT